MWFVLQVLLANPLQPQVRLSCIVTQGKGRSEAGYVWSFHYSPHLVSRLTLCVSCSRRDHRSCRDVRLASCLSMPPGCSLGMVSSRRSVQFLQPWKVQLSLRLVYSDRILTPTISSKRPEALECRDRVFRRPWGRVRFRALVVLHFEITVPVPVLCCHEFTVLHFDSHVVRSSGPTTGEPAATSGQAKLHCNPGDGVGMKQAMLGAFTIHPTLFPASLCVFSAAPETTEAAVTSG